MFSFLASKKKFKALVMISSGAAILLGSAFLVTLFFLWQDRDAVLIQSQESRTLTDGPVFNRIKWISEPTRDIWLMQQSHEGVHAANWDRLAIVVDKTKSPKVAKFYQMQPGALTFEPEKGKEFRASCFMCHSNGPRAIRPQIGSANAPITAWGKAKIVLWNIRVKTYGRVLADESHAVTDTHLKTPFRHSGVFENETLKVKTCVLCHQDGGWVKRGPLTRQNFIAIQVMVETGNMPPPGFHLAEEEKKQIREFVLGL
jgi:hypothetical protein